MSHAVQIVVEPCMVRGKLCGKYPGVIEYALALMELEQHLIIIKLPQDLNLTKRVAHAVA